MINHEIKIAFTEYETLAELDSANRELCLEAVKAMANSHSPYSKFRVGVAMRLASDLHDAIRLRERSPVASVGAAIVALWGAAALAGSLAAEREADS